MKRKVSRKCYFSDVVTTEWDPLSLLQTNRLAQILNDLHVYPTLTRKSKPFLKLLEAVRTRIDEAIKNDVFIPMFSKQSDLIRFMFLSKKWTFLDPWKTRIRAANLSWTDSIGLVSRLGFWKIKAKAKKLNSSFSSLFSWVVYFKLLIILKKNYKIFQLVRSIALLKEFLSPGSRFELAIEKIINPTSMLALKLGVQNDQACERKVCPFHLKICNGKYPKR